MSSNDEASTTNSTGMSTEALRQAVLQAQRGGQTLSREAQMELLRRIQRQQGQRFPVPLGSCIRFRRLSDGRLRAQVNPPTAPGEGARHDDDEGQSRRPVPPGVLQLIGQQLNSRFRLPPLSRVEIFQLGEEIHAHVAPSISSQSDNQSGEALEAASQQISASSGETNAEEAKEGSVIRDPVAQDSENVSVGVPAAEEESPPVAERETVAIESSVAPAPASSTTSTPVSSRSSSATDPGTSTSNATGSTASDANVQGTVVAPNTSAEPSESSASNSQDEANATNRNTVRISSDTANATLATDDEEPSESSSSSNPSGSRNIRLRLPPRSNLQIVEGQDGRPVIRVSPNPNTEGPNDGDIGRFVTLRLGQGDELPTIRMGSAALNNNNNGTNLLSSSSRQPIVPLPDLSPAVAPDNQQDICSCRAHTPKDSERFTCGICYEFLDIPSSCGRCASRFCRECLQKVLRHGNRNTEKLCPTCRNPIDTIHEDKDLLKEMQETAKVSCRFRGCGAKLSLADVKDHEKHKCPRVRVSCRYHAYGCPWKGLRGNLAQHEEEKCALAKVSGLVQEHRVLQERLHRTSREMGGRIHALGHVVDYQRDLIRRHTGRSATSPLDILSFALTALSSTPHLIRTKEAWFNVYATPQARAQVFNFLTLLPTFILLVRLLLVDYLRLSALLRADPVQEITPEVEEREWEDLLDATICIFALTVAGILILICFLVDNKSGEKWSNYRIPKLEEEKPVIFYISAIAFFLAFSLVFDIIGGFFTSAFVMLTLFIASTLLPSAVATFSCRLARTNGPTLVESTGRAALPLLFGLRYAFVSYILGMRACADAFCILFLLESSSKLSPQLVRMTLGYKEVFSDLPSHAYVAYAAVRLADSFSQPDSYLAAILALVLILLVNCVFSRLNASSAFLGGYLHFCCTELRPFNSSSSSDSTIPAGLAVLAASMTSILVLANV